jgi:small subunit ribosomal protein S17
MKTFEGTIVSVKSQNTAVVEIVRKTPHPLYKKLMKRSKKFKADYSGMELSVGQKVTIVETRPISKGKFFKVLPQGKTKRGEKKNDTA